MVARRAALALLCVCLAALVLGSGGLKPLNPGAMGGKLRRKKVPKQQGRSLIESKEPWVEQLSWEPRAYLYHNFISEQQADHIVRMAKPFMKRSTVVGKDGGSVLDSIRTSYGTFLNRFQDPVLTDLEQRIAKWTHLNASHQEDVQILQYGVGQKYGAHYDVLEDGSKRIATVLVYLADTEEGGETAFPQSAKWLDESLPRRLGPFSPCAEGHVAARPKKGDALLFYSLRPDGKHQDPHSMHTGCPVVRGQKWTATVWIHTDPFRPEQLQEIYSGKQTEIKSVLPEECEDAHPMCKTWADQGECERNPGFMAEDAAGLGKCRFSCGACEVCERGDAACRNRNRVRAGFLPLDDA